MEPVDLADRAREFVLGERSAVAQRVDDLREQAAHLSELAEQVEAELHAAEARLRRVDEMLGLAPQLSIHAHGVLRGRELRDMAVELLRARRGVGEAVHYRDWYSMVVDSGGRIPGKDPLASFLTQVTKHEAVESVRPRSGLYRLRIS